MLPDPLSVALVLSVISRFHRLDFPNHKNKNKFFLSGNKICDKLNKMSTRLVRDLIPKSLMHRDEGCYGQLGLLLSIGPTHHVNYWTSLADLVCNAESLENLSASNTAVPTIFFFRRNAI